MRFVACSILAVLLAAGCRAEKEAAWDLLTFQKPLMGTLFTIRVWVDRSREHAEEPEEAIRRAFDEVARLEAIFSDYQPESELNQLALSPPDKPFPVSPELFSVFERAALLYRSTGGAFDITVAPMIRQWRLSRKNHQLPSPENLARAKERSGFDKLELDATNRTITKRASDMRFDLGGIAKGIAADAALSILKKAGFPRSLVAASGDIALGDPPPDSEGWTVGIESLELHADHSGMATVQLSNQAISTSGDTRQFVEIDGVRYSHIVDPLTGLGLTERISVSIIAPDATTSDSLATATSVLGAKDGLQFIENTRGVECRIVTIVDGKEVFIQTSGFLHGSEPPAKEE